MWWPERFFPSADIHVRHRGAASAPPEGCRTSGNPPCGGEPRGNRGARCSGRKPPEEVPGDPAQQDRGASSTCAAMASGSVRKGRLRQARRPEPLRRGASRSPRPGLDTARCGGERTRRGPAPRLGQAPHRGERERSVRCRVGAAAAWMSPCRFTVSAGPRHRGECVWMSTGGVSQTAAAYCLSNPARASSSRVWKSRLPRMSTRSPGQPASSSCSRLCSRQVSGWATSPRQMIGCAGVEPERGHSARNSPLHVRVEVAETAGSTLRRSRGRRGGDPTRSTCVPGPDGEIEMAAVPSSRSRACIRGSLAVPSAPAPGGGRPATHWPRTVSGRTSAYLLRDIGRRPTARGWLGRSTWPPSGSSSNFRRA